LSISSIHIGSVDTASVGRLIIVEYGVNVFDRYLISRRLSVRCNLQAQYPIATFEHSSRLEPAPRNSLIHCQHYEGKRKDTDWGGECKIDRTLVAAVTRRQEVELWGHESDMVGVFAAKVWGVQPEWTA